MGFVRVFSQNVSTFVTACRLAVIARRKLPGSCPVSSNKALQPAIPPDNSGGKTAVSIPCMVSVFTLLSILSPPLRIISHFLFLQNHRPCSCFFPGRSLL